MLAKKYSVGQMHSVCLINTGLLAYVLMDIMDYPVIRHLDARKKEQYPGKNAETIMIVHLA